ncbi:MAG: hypothetical protein KKH98_12930 [Spirochaetes bacterium]|nr:hypothetical protein [Spirochaetota bacterium]
MKFMDENVVQTTDEKIEETDIKPLDVQQPAGIQIPEQEVEKVIDENIKIDENMCCIIYETVFNMTSSLLVRGTEVELPQNRVKSQGKLLCKLFEKYSIGTENMDTVLFLIGCAMDYKFVMQYRKVVSKNE